MIVRTCLLISDDPDDHIEFSEALYEISDDTVLVTVADLRKAVELLTLKKCIPEFIFVDLAITGFDAETFFKALDDPALRQVQLIACGEPSDFAALPNGRVSAFLNADLSYSELKAFLGKVVGK